MTRTDDELVLAMAAGDRTSLALLLLRHEKRAWTIARRFLGDGQEAKDIVQKAFLRIYKGARRYEARGRFQNYLRTVVTRLCLNHRERKRPLPRERVSDIPAPPDSVSSKVRRNRERSAVRRCLDLLPTRQRMALVLRYYDGASYDDIASALDTSAKAVERLLGRGRIRLSRLLSKAVFQKAA